MSYTSHAGGIVKRSYIPLAVPTGAIAAEAHWQFDNTANDLVDRTGNGHNWTLVAGTTMHSYCVEGLVGLDFNGLARYTAALPTNLRIVGDVTFEILMRKCELQTHIDTIIDCSANGETLATNTLWNIAVLTSQRIRLASEHGAGVDDSVEFIWTALAGQLQLVTITRTAAGAATLYLNSRLVQASNMTPPTGGTSATVQMGDIPATGQQFHGKVYSIRISAQVLTAAQILEVYNSVYDT